MTRTVTDMAKLLDVMVGYDPDDPVTALGVGHIPDSYTKSLDKNGLKGARIGILREPMGYTTEPDSEDFKAVTDGLRQGGGRTEDGGRGDRRSDRDSPPQRAAREARRRRRRRRRRRCGGLLRAQPQREVQDAWRTCATRRDYGKVMRRPSLDSASRRQGMSESVGARRADDRRS